MPDGDDDDDDDDVLRFVNRFVYTCALYRELCNTQAHYSRSCSRFVSRPLFLSLFLSLSRKQSEYSKVVSTLSRVRVFMEKRTMLFDGVPQRERERESVFAQRARKSTTTRDSTTCRVRRKECICELNFCFRSQRRSSKS